MSNTRSQNEVTELIKSLEKAAPKSCSKPKSEMCTKCLDRVFNDKALQIQDFLKQLKVLKSQGKLVPARLETDIIELLNTQSDESKFI